MCDLETYLPDIAIRTAVSCQARYIQRAAFPSVDAASNDLPVSEASTGFNQQVHDISRPFDCSVERTASRARSLISAKGAKSEVAVVLNKPVTCQYDGEK